MQQTAAARSTATTGSFIEKPLEVASTRLPQNCRTTTRPAFATRPACRCSQDQLRKHLRRYLSAAHGKRTAAQASVRLVCIRICNHQSAYLLALNQLHRHPCFNELEKETRNTLFLCARLHCCTSPITELDPRLALLPAQRIWPVSNPSGYPDSLAGRHTIIASSSSSCNLATCP